LTDNAAEFDLWSARVTLGVMETVAEAMREKAGEFQRRTGIPVLVTYPAQAPSGLSHTARELLFLKLSLGDVDVHVYSARNPGKYPSLHVVAPTAQLAPTSSQRKGAAAVSHRSAELRELAKLRVISTMVCRVFPTREGGYVLFEPASTERRARLDDIIHRVFEQVVNRRQEVHRS
jgi:hypothetical protein